MERQVLENCAYSSISKQQLLHIASVVETQKKCTLKNPVYCVQEEFDNIVATTWKHDEDLGRGFLLISTSGGHGQIWQWETGGGPIPIGRTLHLANAGCRSNLFRNCSAGMDYGSGGVVVDALKEPRLIVAEWGEGRISRLEENGARTPLVIQLKEQKRVHQPFQLLMTPFGDLMVIDLDGADGSFSLWQLPQATHIPGLESLAVSREAHSWNSVKTTTKTPKQLLHATLGGMALKPNEWLQVYVTMRQEDGAVVVVRLSLDDEDEGDAEVEAGEKSDSKVRARQSKIVLDYSSFASAPGAMEVDEKGNIYLVVDGGVLFVDGSSYTIVGKISISDESLVDLTLGEDRYLYISTRTKLFRMRVRNGPLKIPTDLIIHP